MGFPAALPLLVALLAGAEQPRPPVEALARETYQMVTRPSALPPEVQSALARHLGQEKLHVAAADEPFTRTDLVMDRSLPGRRLVAAAVGKKYAVVHFEQGGIALRRHLVAFERGNDVASVVWSGTLPRTYEPPEVLERALRDRSLWKKAVSR